MSSINSLFVLFLSASAAAQRQAKLESAVNSILRSMLTSLFEASNDTCLIHVLILVDRCQTLLHLRGCLVDIGQKTDTRIRLFLQTLLANLEKLSPHPRRPVRSLDISLDPDGQALSGMLIYHGHQPQTPTVMGGMMNKIV